MAKPCSGDFKSKIAALLTSSLSVFTEVGVVDAHEGLEQAVDLVRRCAHYLLRLQQQQQHHTAVNQQHTCTTVTL